jgi:hypothetical protein
VSRCRDLGRTDHGRYQGRWEGKERIIDLISSCAFVSLVIIGVTIPLSSDSISTMVELSIRLHRCLKKIFLCVFELLEKLRLMREAVLYQMSWLCF